ncbi:hypothetical protein HanXRQr2_Chr02g0064341 [Helianthus annuus]|uniref:Uncharacterized protein n=1 Tax=Helianthus annuus TaxID=4232 RepID=A0A9K3JMP0_HELAN|nr:hypothetical protein HanXRQr2_Chr02g0064341 [Helianthus annuus]KAJ0604666.1 hypothetical protein HanHA300_Chr02g0052791 [Helianthus annuus]
MEWVSWDRVTTPWEAGGLELTPLLDVNTTLSTKCWWRYKREQNALWRRVVWAINCSCRNCSLLLVSNNIYGAWKLIAKLKNIVAGHNLSLGNLIKGDVGRGIVYDTALIHGCRKCRLKICSQTSFGWKKRYLDSRLL